MATRLPTSTIATKLKKKIDDKSSYCPPMRGLTLKIVTLDVTELRNTSRAATEGRIRRQSSANNSFVLIVPSCAAQPQLDYVLINNEEKDLNRGLVSIP